MLNPDTTQIDKDCQARLQAAGLRPQDVTLNTLPRIETTDAASVSYGTRPVPGLARKAPKSFDTGRVVEIPDQTCLEVALDMLGHLSAGINLEEIELLRDLSAVDGLHQLEMQSGYPLLREPQCIEDAVLAGVRDCVRAAYTPLTR